MTEKKRNKIIKIATDRMRKTLDNLSLDDWTPIVEPSETTYSVFYLSSKNVHFYVGVDEFNDIAFWNEDIKLKKAVKKILKKFMYEVAENIQLAEEYQSSDHVGYMYFNELGLPEMAEKTEETEEKEFTPIDRSYLGEPNSDLEYFVDDAANNCGFPLNDDYMTYQEFNETLYNLLDIPDTDIMIDEESYPDGTSDMILTIISKEHESRFGLNNYYKLYRTSEVSDDVILEHFVDEIKDHFSNFVDEINNDSKNHQDGEKETEETVNYDYSSEKFKDTFADTLMPYLVAKDKLTAEEEATGRKLLRIEPGENILPDTQVVFKAEPVGYIYEDMMDKIMVDLNFGPADLLIIAAENISNKAEFKTLKKAITDEAINRGLPREIIPEITYPKIFVYDNPAILINMNVIEEFLDNKKLTNAKIYCPSDNEIIICDTDEKISLEKNSAFTSHAIEVHNINNTYNYNIQEIDENKEELE